MPRIIIITSFVALILGFGAGQTWTNYAVDERLTALEQPRPAAAERQLTLCRQHLDPQGKIGMLCVR